MLSQIQAIPCLFWGWSGQVPQHLYVQIHLGGLVPQDSFLLPLLCAGTVWRSHWGRIKSFFVVLLHGFWHWENL